MTIKIFTSSNCAPCQELKDYMERGRIQAPEEIEIVEIDKSPIGYQQFLLEAVQDGQGVIPTAIRDGEKCQVLVDKENDSIIIQCPGAEPEVINPTSETPGAD